MEFFILACAFILGIIIGSFLNVLVLRYNTGKSLGGRSGCFSCGKTLQWYELIPLFSYIAQKGRCRMCKTHLSVQYPLVEFATGVAFFLSALVALPLLAESIIAWALQSAFFMAISAVLIAISAYDIRHKIIPDRFVIIFLGLSLGYIFFSVGFSDMRVLFEQLFSGFLIASPLAFIWLISRGRWMGFGDVKFSLGMGWLLGITSGFSALILSFWLGAIVGLCILAIQSLRFGRTRLTIKSEIPFGPFLVFGTLVLFFFPFNLFAIFFAFS